MNAYFFRFSKRKNSTKQPAIADAAFTLNINLNDPNSSLLTPVIRVTAPAARQTAPRNIWNCNYCLIPDLDRYYYISNWEWNADGTWSGICDVDVLASWKSYIRQSGGYVGRSTTMSDPYLADALYPSRSVYVRAKTESNTGFTPTPSGGSFIIGVIGKQNPSIGAVTYYLVSAAQLQVLVENMTAVADPSYFVNSGTLLDDVSAFMKAGALQSMVNPLQYITSCKWFPFSIGAQSQSGNIKIWGWDSGAVGYRLDATYTVIPGTLDSWNTIAVPDVVDMEPVSYITNPVTRDRYPVYAPFATYTMITAWGTFDLDPAVIAFQMTHAGEGVTTNLYYQFIVNLITGEAIFKVATRYNGEYELFRRNITLAVDIPLAQLTWNTYANMDKLVSSGMQLGDSVIGLIGQIFGGQSGGSGIGSSMYKFVSGIRDYSQSFNSPEVKSTSSTNAAFTPDIGKIIIESIRFQSVEKSNTLFGKPVKAVAADLTSMSGYVQMDYTNFDGPCTDTERDSVVAFLEGGIYIE